jgi:SAM-dependent methyltransferase
MNDLALLESYPRHRPPLPEAYREIYEREYKLNREGEKPIEGMAKRLEGWMHRRVAALGGGSILELGAGTLNHLRYERDLGDCDIVEPFTSLYEGSTLLKHVRHVYRSTAEIPKQARYDRIISVAVLEHIEDLPCEIARCCLHLNQGGVFQAGIPSEGGFLWWLGWRATTGISYWLRNRLDYGVLMRHEHLSTGPEIIRIVRLLFTDVSVRRFFLPFHHLSLYAYVEARNPNMATVDKLLT